MPVSAVPTKTFLGQLAFGDASGLNPLASTSYYFGTLYGVDPGTVDGPPAFTVPMDGRLVSVFGSFYVVGSTAGAGGANTVFVRKNSTANILTVTSTVDLRTNPQKYQSTGNSIPVSKGDQVYAKWTTPAWGSSGPTFVFGNMELYFESP